MAIKQISKNVYSVGVINPASRIFDVMIEMEYGTTYNAFLIKNNGKSALIEAVHADYFNEYLENIQSVLGNTAPDYLILNHNEPDHSGTVAQLMEVYPNLSIITSKAGAIYLKNIVNKTLAVKTVADQETVDLGGDELKFIMAPFLHWPDTMLTYFAKDKTLFPCDFFGAHYCETLFDYDLKHRGAYESEFANYFKHIFSPFKPYVLSGLEKIKDLDIETIAVSHGPVLTKKTGYIDYTKKLYTEWCQPHTNEIEQIPIFYCSAYGYTGILANHIKTGIKQAKPNANVEIYELNSHDLAKMSKLMHSSDAFLIGSPTINRDAVRPAWELINTIDAISMKGRPCAVFGSYGWSGEGCGNLISRLQGLKLQVKENPCRCQFVPSTAEMAAAVQFGKEFAESLPC